MGLGGSLFIIVFLLAKCYFTYFFKGDSTFNSARFFQSIPLKKG